jgi:hypothetical protein
VRQLRRVTDVMEAQAVDIENARAELRTMHDRGRQLAVQWDALAQQASETNQLRHRLDLMYASTSWRITRPLRALAHPGRAIRILLGRLRRS